MQIATGTVIDGKVVIEEGEPLVEGATVAVLARGPDDSFRLSDEDDEALVAAMAEIERGEFISADQLLESLRRFG